MSSKEILSLEAVDFQVAMVPGTRLAALNLPWSPCREAVQTSLI